jgi:hypothetical protein
MRSCEWIPSGSAKESPLDLFRCVGVDASISILCANPLLRRFALHRPEYEEACDRGDLAESIRYRRRTVDILNLFPLFLSSQTFPKAHSTWLYLAQKVQEPV